MGKIGRIKHVWRVCSWEKVSLTDVGFWGRQKGQFSESEGSRHGVVFALATEADSFFFFFSFFLLFVGGLQFHKTLQTRVR